MNLKNGYKNQKDSDPNTLESFKILISNIKYLKDKTWGCPWQKMQSHKSLIPFLNEESSEFIDAIYIFNEDTPIKLIESIRPDILVKGADYEENKIVGSSFVKSYGGKISRIELVKNQSSSNIINTIKDFK